MKFRQSVIDFICEKGNANKLSEKFEVSINTVVRWAAGTAIPLKRMQVLILKEIDRLNRAVSDIRRESKK